MLLPLRQSSQTFLLHNALQTCVFGGMIDLHSNPPHIHNECQLFKNGEH